MNKKIISIAGYIMVITLLGFAVISTVVVTVSMFYQQTDPIIIWANRWIILVMLASITLLYHYMKKGRVNDLDYAC